MARIMFVTSNRELPSSFSRASSSWLAGAEVGPDELRAFGGLTPVALVERESSNLFLHSLAPVEQVITGTGPHTVSVGGMGRARINGGALGTALRDRPVTINLAGSITVTPENGATWVQVEPGSSATSLIPTGSEPVTRAADSWSADVPLSGVLNIAGVIQPGRADYVPWLEAAGLSIGQLGRAVRVTLGTQEALLPAPLGWNAITLLQAGNGVLVAHNNREAATLLGELSTPAPTVITGDTFVAFSSYPLRVPHTDPDGTTWQHRAWLSSLKALGVEPDPLNIMSLDMSRGTFYFGVW